MSSREQIPSVKRQRFWLLLIILFERAKLYLSRFINFIWTSFLRTSQIHFWSTGTSTMGQLLIFFSRRTVSRRTIYCFQFFSYFNLTFIKFFLERFVLLFVFADYLINFFVIVFTSWFKRPKSIYTYKKGRLLWRHMWMESKMFESI